MVSDSEARLRLIIGGRWRPRILIFGGEILCLGTSPAQRQLVVARRRSRRSIDSQEPEPEPQVSHCPFPSVLQLDLNNPQL